MIEALSDLSNILLGIPAILLLWAVGLTARQRKLWNLILGDETREGLLDRLGQMEEDMATEQDLDEAEERLETKIEEEAPDAQDMEELKGMLSALLKSGGIDPSNLDDSSDPDGFLGDDD